METKSVHVAISGRVQGVGYRAWVKRTADELGVSGWVRNCRTGEVEAVFSGDAAAVDAMIAACRDGPGWAKVADIEVLGPAEMASGPLTILADR
jgi:acylphosphatase